MNKLLSNKKPTKKQLDILHNKIKNTVIPIGDQEKIDIVNKNNEDNIKIFLEKNRKNFNTKNNNNLLLLKMGKISGNYRVNKEQYNHDINYYFKVNIDNKILNNTKIIYINLDNRPDRKNTFESFYKKENINVQRFSANKMTIQDFSYKYPHLDLYKFHTRFKRSSINWINGTLGCYSSHYDILKDNLDSDLEYLVVLEDDCTIKKKDLIYSLSYLKEHPDIDILRVNNWHSKNIHKTQPFKFDQINKHSKFAGKSDYYSDGGTHICIYKVSNIQNIINYLEEEYVYQIDAVFSTNKINSWCIRVPNEIKYFSISSIQQGHHWINK